MRAFLQARRQHPAWVLLAARRGPLVLACLTTLFEQAESREGVLWEDALESLARALTEQGNDAELAAEDSDPQATARRELRDWIKRALIIEREGRIHATDALETALRFVESLDGRIMTSTASRLSVVQREIERLESGLNPDADARRARLRRQIAELEQELAAVEAGEVPVLDPAAAVEGIREVYTLAIGLRADFRRVEDSWREADRGLRHAIVQQETGRGAVVDSLLDGHDSLLQTAEGRVFQSFQQQLSHSGALDAMKLQLRSILKHPHVQGALKLPQQLELRWLVMQLVRESSAVIRARARSERDVRSFLKTGLAAEQHRVGQLLNEVLALATRIDWRSQRVRRSPAALPPLGFHVAGLPAVERLRFKSLDAEGGRELALQQRRADLQEVEPEFWAAFDGLDREALLQNTLATLRASTEPLGLPALAERLPPSHDLETLALWLGMAREAGIEFGEAREALELGDEDGRGWRFDVPRVRLSAQAFEGFEWEP